MIKRTLALWACLLCASASFGEKSHKIGDHDTLEKIAKRYGVSASKIRKANPHLNERKLRPGAKIRIPSDDDEDQSSKRNSKKAKHHDEPSASKSGVHTVRDGETAASVARKYGLSREELADLNDRKNLRHLREGQRLVVRAKKKEVAKAKPDATPIKVKVHGDYAKIKGDSVIMRKLPRLDSAKVGLREHGTVGRVIDRRESWLELRFADGLHGWVRGDLVVAATASDSQRFVAWTTKKTKTSDSDDSDGSYVKEVKPKATPVAAKTPPVAKTVVAKSEPKKSTKSPTKNSAPQKATQGADGVIDYAKTMIGTRYVWGGTSRGGFDCSGFVGYVMRHAGVNLPRTAAEQATRGSFVSRSDLRKGDLIFFNTRGNRISHVGMYIGGGQFIHASSGAGHIRISYLSENYYSSRYVTARRVGNFSDVGEALDTVKKELEDSGELPKPADKPEAKVRPGADEISK